ncbi:MAG TPA: hypothetical protein VIM71_06870 [Lacunisphaera sp.]
MNTTIRSTIIISAALAGLASVASAQGVTGAVNSATHGAATIMTPPPAPPPPATPPPPAVSLPPPATVSAGAASQGAANAVVRTPIAPPATASSAAAANSAVGGSVTTGLNANANTHASAAGQAHGLSVASEASRQASVTVNTADTVALIKQSAFAARDNVTAEVQARADASAKIVADLEVKAEQGGEKSRAALAKSLVEVRAREKALRASLREAAKTTKESTWGEVQSELAKNYGDYAKAVAEAEVAADATASAR